MQALLTTTLKQACLSLFEATIENFEFQSTRKEFEGDITLVVFPLLRHIKGNPVKIGEELGAYLQENLQEVTGYNVVKGFLNIVISDTYYLDFFNTQKTQTQYGFITAPKDDPAVLVEYSSPNTNKPLHLGHIRNNLLGYSVAEILKASGRNVYKTQIINDRGIHICKSMLAWQKFGKKNNGKWKTPESEGKKGDKFVGRYYVDFDKAYKEQYKNEALDAKKEFDSIVRNQLTLDQKLDSYKAIEMSEFHIAYCKSLKRFCEADNPDFKFKSSEGSDYGYKDFLFLDNPKELIESRTKFFDIYKSLYGANGESNYPSKTIQLFKKIHEEEFTSLIPILKEAQAMLLKWEQNDAEVVALWKKMNQWVYDGFAITYNKLGVDFHKNYYESDTYKLGKNAVEKGLKDGVFYKKEDGSVWIDLTDDGLDEKLVLRSDGTSVYMTQDIGTAMQRSEDFKVDGMVYTVGNEQDYHFKVLFLILKKLGYTWADDLFHLSYGMVDLPSGKMKSREGTVVDADDLISEMHQNAKTISEELGKLDGYSDAQKEEVYETIGLGALKYYILKVDPKKRILFDPKESIDFQGNTGPFIQYTYARIQSIVRKSAHDQNITVAGIALHEKEKEILKLLEQFPEVIQQAAKQYSPALVANYTYDVVKAYNSFFQNVSIFGAETPELLLFRAQLSQWVGSVVSSGMSLLGVHVPERM